MQMFDVLNISLRRTSVVLLLIHLNVDALQCCSLFSTFYVDMTAIFSPGYGITVAGGCNGNTSTNQTQLTRPNDVMLLPNGTLYVANEDGKVLAFDRNSRTGRTVAILRSSSLYFFHFHNRTSDLYVSVYGQNFVQILPGNRTIPSNVNATGVCVLTEIIRPTVITMDSAGNLYVASHSCNWITRWAPNVTAGVLIAGSPTGSSGSSNILLDRPYGLSLDELNSVIYVVDRFNHRIQRFPLDGSGIGVTVAGGNGLGSAPNQLNNPTEIYRSNNGNFMYICDIYNYRVQRWPMNGTSGITVAGSSSGITGQTPYLMNKPYALAIDTDEKYIYVSDSNNHRIQRFSLI
jgi:DNA-binding beta-propeller fold protein YncE